MKYFYACLFLLACVSGTAQINVNFGYSLGAPQQKMGNNINPVHSVTTGVMYQFPKFKKLQAGIDMSWGSYANTQKDQTFTFDNGVSTTTQVNYSSNSMQASAHAKYMLLSGKNVTPYFSGRAGYTSYYSSIFIEDPHDPDGCKALDQRTLIKDGTMFVAYGGGLQFDWALFNGGEKGDRFIDFSVNSVRGGAIEYINTKKLIDANNPPATSGGKPLNVKFINATTQQIHEHQIAEVYNTPLRLLEFKLTAVFAF